MGSMKKNANTKVPLHPHLQERWSPRAFSSKTIDDDTFISLLEAARWAPSSRNLQPWRFIVETQADPQGFQKLADCLMPSNRDWAQHAFVLAVIVSERQAPDSDAPNGTADYDAGQAVAALSIQAMEKDIFVHQMGGIYRDKIVEAYELAQGYAPIAVLAIGYQGALEDLAEALQEREKAERSRKNLSEIVFKGSWVEKNLG